MESRQSRERSEKRWMRATTLTIMSVCPVSTAAMVVAMAAGFWSEDASHRFKYFYPPILERVTFLLDSAQ